MASKTETLAPASENEKAQISSGDSTSATVENANVPVVDEETERRLMKKLDRRIIPVCCWIYLMNFMDRGELRTRLPSRYLTTFANFMCAQLVSATRVFSESKRIWA